MKISLKVKWLSDTDFLVLYLIPILTFFAGFFFEFFTHILETYWDEHRTKVSERNFSRKDLKAQLQTFCDSWDDRQCIAPVTDFRNDLLVITKDIRQRVNERSAELNEEEKTAIRKTTNDFMKLAGKSRTKTSVVWIQEIEGEMDKVCKEMRQIATRLT